MREFVSSIKNGWANLDRTIYVGDRYRSNMLALTMVSVVSAILGFVLVVINVFTKDTIMLVASVVTFFSAVACGLFAGVFKNRKIAIIIPQIFCIIAISIYIVTGAASGSAILWAILVPIGISYFVSVKYGIIQSGYFTLLIIIVFNSPLKATYEQYYNHMFMTRFPMMYTCFAVFTAMSMIQYHRSVLFEIDHTNELTEEVERQTAVAEDLMEVMDVYVSSAIDDTDGISGIMSRGAGEMVITKALMSDPGCFIFFDVDNLKKINDIYGHEAGDRILHIMGDTLRTNSEDHLCCRLGGDEFLMFMKNVSDAEAVDRVKKIIRDFNDNKKDDLEVAIASLSAGMVMTTAGEKYEEAYNKADKALYYVKQNGKSGFDFYKSDYDSVSNINLDVNKLVDSIKNSGSYKGAMSVEYREFAKLYEFIANLEQRFSYPFKMIVITLELPSGENPGVEELERAMFNMEKSIRQAIRDVDVLTRYSNRQFLVILLGSHPEGVRTAVDRIFADYNKMSESEKFVPSYTIAESKA